MTWVKGQSGNPRGRYPLAQELTPAIRSLLRQKDPATGIPNRKLIALALVGKAMAGDLEAIRIVLERIDGRLVTSVTHSGPDGGPISLSFDYTVTVTELTTAALAPGSNGHRLPPGPAQSPLDGASLGEDADGG